MQVRPFVLQVQAQLAAAAALGDEAARSTADALAAAAEPAVRLAVLGAVSAAADEITAALLDAPGAPGVSVHIDGDDLRVVVRPTDLAEPAPDPSTAAGDEGENSARISLRLPEALKGQIEAAARADTVSVNTWLLRAASAALSGNRDRRPGIGAARLTGWING